MRGSLCGYVVRGAGDGAVAQAYVEAVSDQTLEPRSVRTDSDGWFVLDGLPPGRWLLHAWSPDQHVGEASAQVFADAFGDVTIRLGDAPASRTVKAWVARMQHGSVDGRVVRAGNREPVADASISVLRGPGPAPDIAPLSGADGRFRLDLLLPGAWVLQALTPAGETGQATVQVAAGGETRVDIEVSPAQAVQ